MSTSSFGAIEDMGNHSDDSIPNPDLSDMELDAPEELPLPRRMGVHANTMNHIGTGFFSVCFILDQPLT